MLIPEEAVAPNPTADFAEILVANTWECNLSCSYCFVAKNLPNARGGMMTPVVAGRVMDALDSGFPDVETVCVHLYGGEPLLNLHAIRAMLQKTVNYKERRFAFAITTNGTIVDPEVFELLKTGRFTVILSVDGPPEVHDGCRRTKGGGPSHSTVMDFLGNLRARTRCRVWGSAVVRSGWSLRQAEDYLSSLPVDAIKAQAIRVCESGPFALTTAERIEYQKHLAEIGDQVIRSLEAGTRPRDDRFSSRVLQLLMGISRKRYCDAGQSCFGITPDGTVLGCLLVNSPQNRLGHIDEDPASWRQRGKQWAEGWVHGSDCDNCAALFLCGGGCPAVNPICGDGECDIVRKNCEVARNIYEHFRSRPEVLLGLAGIF